MLLSFQPLKLAQIESQFEKVLRRISVTFIEKVEQIEGKIEKIIRRMFENFSLKFRGCQTAVHSRGGVTTCSESEKDTNIGIEPYLVYLARPPRILDFLFKIRRYDCDQVSGDSPSKSSELS
jgi:hypothetical protein